MTMTMRIGWIRHGVTEWNRIGKIQGATDIPLSQEGEAQARLLAERLSREPFGWDGVVCSDLSRAARTGEIVAARLGLPILVDARLRERSFGEAEGTTADERLARWGADWHNTVPDQESDDSVRARGFDFVREWTERYPGQSWLVVTHGSFLARMLHAMCEGLPDRYLQNMSLTVLERRGGQWELLLYNCTNHLLDASVQAEGK